MIDPTDAAPLNAELDRWEEGGLTLPLWWRDDDAADDTPALRRLMALADRHRAVPALAVIPEPATPALAAVLSGGDAHVLQHGWRHRNHAAPGGRAVECGGDRDLQPILDEFAGGRERLAALFGDRFLPVMVPPWNRIEPRVSQALPAAGYIGLSTFGPPEAAPPGLRAINGDLDVVRWKGGARFAGATKLCRSMVEDLALRRAAGDGRPFALLTHHLAHDEATWDFLAALLPMLSRHPAVRWRDAATLFAPLA
ncbi:polysaccharide deacetylase family protein [Aureimonas sp. AU12]|uniref:polysaccharide deacetylase family protein n=1 Tax=Aureimonas sp. AU12 TaxID=1638161 RepID=UPI000781C667|nr:polysaccharide deacetylase family protein [Aureimonas sp. AU12]